MTPPPTPLPPAVPTFVPVHVTREQTSPDDIHALNEYARQVLVSQNPESVWQYYQLVNVSWPYASKPDLPAKGATVPLDLTYFQFNSSGSQPVSNVALETYVQGSDCSACHNAAPIARSQVTGCERKLAAGFSYMFRNARPSPSSTPCPAAPPEPLGFGP